MGKLVKDREGQACLPNPAAADQRDNRVPVVFQDAGEFDL
jgi:hypothetical protein